MSLNYGYRCIILASFLGLGSLLSAQDKQSVPASVTPTASEDAALHALVEQYIAAYAKKDLNGMMVLWSPNSPELNPRRKELETYFAENDKIAFAHVEIHPASGRGEKVRLRVSVEISAVDAKTGKTSVGSGKVERVFEFVKETGSWKVWREKDAFDDFAEGLVEETNESARTALLKNRGDLATPPLVRALYKLGGEHRSGGDLVKARRSFQLMQQLAEETGDQRGICLAIRNIGILSDMQGDHRQALEYLGKSLDVAEALGDKALIAGSLMILGIIQGGLSDNAEALRYFKRSLEMAESLNDKNLMAKVLANIGEMNRRQGNDSEALEYLQRSLAIDEAEKHDPIQIAITLSNLGSLYRYEGNHARALECFQKSLAILEHGRDAALLRSLLHNMGALYESQGDYDEALDYYQKSLAISNQLGEKDALANNLKSIGYVEEMREHFSIAMEYFQKGLALTEETGDKWESIFLLSRMGEVQAAESKYSEALSTYQKSLALAEELGIQAGLAQNCNNIAQLYYKQNRLQEALEFAQRAASLTLKNGDRESFWGASTLEGLAYRRLGQPDQAHQAFEEAIATIEDLRGQVAGGEEQEQVFFQDKLAPYHGMVELLVARNQLPQALSYAERAKGRALLEVLASGRVNVAKAMTSAERNREQQLQGELVSLNRQVYREMTASKPDQQHLSALKDNLNKARLQYADFQTNLYAAHPELKTQRGQVQPISLGEAADLLPDSQGALLEFVVTDEKAYLFVLTRSSGNAPTIPELKVYTLDIKAKDLDREAKQFRQQLAQRDLQFRAAAAKLFRLLLQPAQAQLAGKTALVIVPDGPLWNLPFQALLGDDNRYLLEKYAISYAPSLTVLREMMRVRQRSRPETPAPQATTLLAMANPILGKVMGPNGAKCTPGSRRAKTASRQRRASSVSCTWPRTAYSTMPARCIRTSCSPQETQIPRRMVCSKPGKSCRWI